MDAQRMQENMAVSLFTNNIIILKTGKLINTMV